MPIFLQSLSSQLLHPSTDGSNRIHNTQPSIGKKKTETKEKESSVDFIRSKKQYQSSVTSPRYIAWTRMQRIWHHGQHKGTGVAAKPCKKKEHDRFFNWILIILRSLADGHCHKSQKHWKPPQRWIFIRVIALLISNSSMLLLSIVGIKSRDANPLSPPNIYKLGHKLIHNSVWIQIEVTSNKVLLLLRVDSPPSSIDLGHLIPPLTSPSRYK